MALMRVVHDLVERAKRDRSIAPVMEFVHDNMKRAQALLRGVTIDCKEGCWFCCTRWVDAKIPEVLYISRVVVGRPDLVEATKTAGETFGQLDYEARKREITPCAMLVDGRCSVYAERPWCAGPPCPGAPKSASGPTSRPMSRSPGRGCSDWSAASSPSPSPERSGRADSTIAPTS